MTMPYRKFLWVTTPMMASVWLLVGCGAPIDAASNTGEVSPNIAFVNKGSVQGEVVGQTQVSASPKKPSIQDYSKYYFENEVVFDIEPTIQKGKIFMRKTQDAAPPREVVSETERLKQEVGALKNQFAATQDAYQRERAETLAGFNSKIQKISDASAKEIQMLADANAKERQALVGEISGLKSSLRQVEASKQILKGEIIALAQKQELDKRMIEERRQAARDERAKSFMEELEIRKKLDEIRRHELLQTAELQKRSALDNERRLVMLESERKSLIGKISDLEGELTQFAREDDVLQTSKSFETMVANLSQQLDILGADAVRRSEFALSDTWTRDALNRLSYTIDGLESAAARKDDIQAQNNAIESRLLAMQNHIEGVKAFADKNRELTFEQRRVVDRVAALSKGIDAIQYQLDSQNSISAAAQTALQGQLASLNDEFTELRKVSASKGDVGATRALVEARANHLNESIALLQNQVLSGQSLDQRAQSALDEKIHEVGLEITALNAAVDYMKDGLDDGLGQTRALRDSIQSQLASLNNEFTALRQISATKGDVDAAKELVNTQLAANQNALDATNALMVKTSQGINESLNMVQEQMERDRLRDADARFALNRELSRVGTDIQALRTHFDYVQGQGDVRFDNYVQSQAGLQQKLDRFTDELHALRAAAAQKSDVDNATTMVEERLAALQSDIGAVKADMASKVDLDTLKADLEEKIFSIKNSAGLARNSADLLEQRTQFEAIQNGENIDSKNLQVAILQPPSVNGDVTSDIRITALPEGYVAETPIENWIDLQDYQVVVHAEDETLEDILGKVVHSATPFTGKWELKWKLKAENQDILSEKFSLNAETSFADFANYISSYMFSYRGFKLSFNLFDKERIVLVTDGE